MEFKNMTLKSIFFATLASISLVVFVMMKFTSRADSTVVENDGPQNPAVELPMAVEQVSGINSQEDIAIQQQLDEDRREQKQTKDLRIKLEQTNLELEEQKTITEINKLKKENSGAFNEPDAERQDNLPEIKVDYIGGDSVNKEAILSIGGTSYQVKEKSNPTDNIQVISISDSSVTLHFSAPQDLTKAIDYKPE